MKIIQFNKGECIPFIYNLTYKFWLWLNFRKFNTEIRTYNNKVFDHLGLIDTLGCQGEVNRFTYNHSEELGYLWGFDLKFIHIEFIND